MSAHAGSQESPVSSRAWFGALTDREIERLNQVARRRSVSAHQTIFSEDENPEYFAIVISGMVKMLKTLPDGRQQIVGLQFPSDFLGRPFGPRNPLHCEAASDVELSCFRQRDLESVLREHPGIEQRMFQHTLDELDSAREWMLLLGRKSAPEKVATFLLTIAHRMARTRRSEPGQSVDAKFRLPLTRSEIADCLGLTIETVSRQMTRLKTRGIIRIEPNRTISIPDLNRLRAASESDKRAKT